jgi:asparagine synthase (glutamine-hydrolysing)
MCGIIGVFGKKASKERLHKMLEAQKHRGPDNTGIYISHEVAIGHNRLAIIDLSEAANQPFISSDERYILVFNGEIYNYLELKQELENSYNFKTQSDTEVLLAAYIKWGEDCLHRLNGMFAFFVWDTNKQELFAARDRFGVKPLYYSFQEDSLFISSEIKTLFEGGVLKTPNNKVWANYFTYGSYGMPSETFWRCVNQLSRGCFLYYQNKKIITKKWYNFKIQLGQQKNNLSISEAKNKYQELLNDSIRLRFRTDVPIGFNVSGGLDSSLLLSLVNTVAEGSNIDAYTFYTNNTDYDELPWVEELLNLTRNPLKKVLFTAKDVILFSEEISYFQDEPFGGIPTLAYANIFKNAAQLGVKVLLDGQGMDEQWAGYDYYTNTSNSVIQGVNKSPLRPNILSEDFGALAVLPDYPKPFNNHVLDLQYRDLFYTKIPRALRFNDRISMAYGTELREPFLDYRLVEFAFSQPLEYKINKGTQKYLPRLLAKDFLPSNIRFAPKRPLQTPQREWLSNDLKQWVMDQVKNFDSYGWLNKQETEKELDLYFKGDQDSSFHIWQLINTSILLS